MSNPRFLKSKYSHLRQVIFQDVILAPFIHRAVPASVEEAAEILTNLPSGFVKNPYAGLGLLAPLTYIVRAIEDMSEITALRVQGHVESKSPAVEGSSYIISATHFEKLRKAINRIHDRALGVAAGQKRAHARNTLLTAVDPAAYPAESPPYLKDMIFNAIGGVVNGETRLSAADGTTIVQSARTAAKRLIRDKPTEMLELRQEIEVVSLEQLIERISDRLARALPERNWQDFLFANSFVLRLAFGLPVTMVGQQISVGGRKLSGCGDKISDFAVKAAASGNLALIEIKTPDTVLLDPKAYRDDLHAPGRELSGAINQVLDQRYKLQQNIHTLKVNSRMYDIETYAVQCLVIAGRTPDTLGKLKSLELFRNGLKSVTVVTYDELLRKLEQLLVFMRQPGEA